jgi:eukaryotic-like serine/threonine-protein kinase
MSEDKPRPADPTMSISTDQTVSDQHTKVGRSDEIRVHRKITPRQLGKYEIKDQLGTGGMGEVYRAYDSVLNRYVALKILYTDNPDAIRRFLEEARIQAGIEHENICKVYEAGQIEGKNFIAMQLIRGRTLVDASADWSFAQKMEVMKTITEALQAAHKKGLIHRDIKPSNIMVEKNESGELKPYILDFGLARGVETPGLTMTGMILGTPPYMAPEQVRSDRNRMDARTDVYALGATLYEIFYREPIYNGTLGEVLAKILNDDPIAIRNSDAIPEDLQTIISKCVEKDPERRYSSAATLADDLRRCLQGEPISAKQTTWSYRWVKKARRHKTITLILSFSAILILLQGIFLLWSRWNTQRQAELALDFGNEIRFIESALRSAYAAPLHDLRPQIAQIKSRLKKLEQRVQSEGRAACGPGYDALGQGYLAIGDYEKARELLQKAWDAGYQQPSTAYALGKVMGHLYDDELRKAERLQSADLRKQKKKDAENNFGRPSIEYLKKAGSYVESPLYVEALIDLYEKRFDQALTKAADAYSGSSWPYEPKKLEGDIHMAIGSNAEESGDYKKALNEYEIAGKKYLEAADLARSNEEIYLALGEQYSTTISQETLSKENRKGLLEKGLEACKNALVANPDSGRGYLCLSQTYLKQGIYVLYWEEADPSPLFTKAIETAEQAGAKIHNGEPYIAASEAYVRLAERATATRTDPRPFLENAIKKSEKALIVDKNSNALHSLASAYFLLGDYELYHGGNPIPPLKKVIEIYPDNSVGVQESIQNTLGLAYMDMAEYKLQRGQNPSDELQKAIEHYKKGLKINPKASYIAMNAALAYFDVASYELAQGQSPQKSCDAALVYYDQAEADNKNQVYTSNNKGLIYLLLGRYLQMQNKDPDEVLQKAVQNFQHSLKLNPQLGYGHINSGSALAVQAEYMIENGQDPTEVLKRAESEAEKGRQLSDEFFEAYEVLGQVHLIRARQLMLKQRSPVTEFEDSRKMYEKSIQINSLYATSYIGLLQTYRWEIEWWKNKPDAAQASANVGLDWVRKTREQKIVDPNLDALEGVFQLALGKSSDGNGSLQKAIKANSLLKQQYEKYLTSSSTPAQQ